MKTPTEAEKKAYGDMIEDQIAFELKGMVSKYDAKTLSIMMFAMACNLMQILHSNGMWDIEGVRNVTDLAMKDLFDRLPVDQLPKEAIRDYDHVLSVPTKQTKPS